MPYSVLMLAYSVCASRSHSPYVPESFPCLPALQHRVFQPAVGRNEPHKALGPGWRLAFMLLSQLLPASCDWSCWAGKKANMQSQQISSQVYVKWSSWKSLANCSAWHRLPEVFWGTGKETPGKGPWLCILFQPIPPQVKLVLPAHLPVQNYNFYVSNLRAAPACPLPVFEVCWLLGL